MKNQQKLGFIGVGNMGGALVRGVASAGAGTFTAADIVVTDTREAVLTEIVEACGVRAVADAAQLVAASEVVVLAVKPQVMLAVLAPLRDRFDPNVHTVVSVAAGLTLAQLEAALPAGTPVVRVMPNTPAHVGLGASAYALGTHADKRHGAIAEAIFGAVGIVQEVTEDEIHAVIAVSGSGPAYFFHMIEALVDGGVAAGLTPEVSRALALQTALGAATLAARSEKPPGLLRQNVMSPGGTTEAAIRSLDKDGFQDVVKRCMAAAHARSVEMGADEPSEPTA
ncbi:MAG: pyrroline-5-carboxylate reductase [Myxococcota bacterium]|jgi:pyrroline-5-carboxylate reductase